MFDKPLYALLDDFSFSGPHQSPDTIPHNAAHIRTLEEWAGLFAVVELMSQTYDNKHGRNAISYFCISYAQMYAIGLHETRESALDSANLIHRAVSAQMKSAFGDLDEAVASRIETLHPLIFSMADIPAMRDKLVQLSAGAP